MDDRRPSTDEVFGFLLTRRLAKPWRAGPRRHPKMPRGPWWAASIACVTLGCAIGWWLFGDSSVGLLRAAACGLATFVVGMVIVETRWARRTARRLAPGSPA